METLRILAGYASYVVSESGYGYVSYVVSGSGYDVASVVTSCPCYGSRSCYAPGVRYERQNQSLTRVDKQAPVQRKSFTLNPTQMQALQPKITFFLNNIIVLIFIHSFYVYRKKKKLTKFAHD